MRGQLHGIGRAPLGHILHGDSVGLFGSCSLDGAPLEETIDRHDAAPQSVSLPEFGSREMLSALALMGLRPPFGVWRTNVGSGPT